MTIHRTPAVRRPKNASWQSALYNGKYGTHVLKTQVSQKCDLIIVFNVYVFCFVQVVCDFTGMPIFFSGPHIGVRSDLRLWQQFGPVLSAGEIMLADKAYVSKDVSNVLAPYKRKKGRRLSRAQRDFNLLHR
ncbi:MAG: transposase family protein [Sulfobacillus sp.]